MGLLYLFGVRLYALVVHLLAPFNAKANKWVSGRRHFFDHLPSVKDQKVIWFHCASLGEFDQGLPVMNEIKRTKPDVFLLVTFFSPSGMDHYSKRDHKVDYACYLPIDTKANAKRFVSHFKPQKAFFVKYEIWVNYILQLKTSNCEIFGVCNIFRPEHRFFKWYGSHFRKALQQFDFFFVQNEQSQELLKTIGITNSLIVGDTRYDRLIDNKQNIKPNHRIEEFLNGEKCVLIGSSWPKDEAIVIPFINAHPEIKFIIAPHQIETNHIKEITADLKEQYQLFTNSNNNSKILILNTIGHLTSAYQYGTWAYVGGGFSGNLHNILEPTVFGLPVVFGPKFKRFPEAQQFIDAGHAFSVQTTNDLEDCFSKFESQLNIISSKSLESVEKYSGATLKIIQKIDQSFPF